jgi:thiol-disulfide isomerase/thioredoxin
MYLFGGVALLIVAVLVFGVYTGIRDADKVDQLLIDLYQGQEELGATNDEIRFEDILSQGKPTVLNFWGGDCPPCRAEMPDLQRSYEANGTDVVFFGMDSGRYFGLGTPRSAQSLMNELSVTYPIGGPPNRTPITQYAVRGLPATMFIDAEGNLFRRWDGLITQFQLDTVIAEMLRTEADSAS